MRIDAVISKYLLFDFVNFYGILIYIALGKVWVQKTSGILGNPDWNEQCLYNNCMFELTIQMAVIFIGRSLVQHWVNFLSPLINRGWQGFRRSKMAQKMLKKRIKANRKLEKNSEETLKWSKEVKVPQYFIDANVTSFFYIKKLNLY
jgi:hypothetical protein